MDQNYFDGIQQSFIEALHDSPELLLLLIAILVCIILVAVFSSKAAQLRGGKRIIEDGPLGNARFATEKELQAEYPTITYDFEQWCEVGTKRQQHMLDRDLKSLKLLKNRAETNPGSDVSGTVSRIYKLASDAVDQYKDIVEPHETMSMDPRTGKVVKKQQTKLEQENDVLARCKKNFAEAKVKRERGSADDPVLFQNYLDAKEDLDKHTEAREKLVRDISKAKDNITDTADEIYDLARNSKERGSLVVSLAEDARKREEEYSDYSVGLPTEPGLLLGDWHENEHGKKNIKPTNPVGKAQAEKNNTPKKGYPNYPWYFKMKEVETTDPITGQKVKTHKPCPIRTYDEQKDGTFVWNAHSENWAGGKVKTRVCTDDIHALMVASSGAGKSAFFLYPQAVYAMCSGISFAITDTKGDNAAALAQIAHDSFGYKTLSLDLRNPTKSCKFNIMHMVNKYTDLYDACDDKNSPEAIAYAAKRERYAKIVAQTIVKGSVSDYGANSFFYDSAEGLISAAILLVSEYGNRGYDPVTHEYNPELDDRHIVSVYHLIQDVSGTEGSGDDKKTGISVLLDKLDPNDKIKMFAGPSAQSAGDSQASVVSTAMSKLLNFLDTEMEQILCGRSDIDAEDFCHEKTILFITMPEENATRYFLVSLVISELYNELLTIASTNNNYIPTPKGFRGKKARIMFFLDEFGTLPKVEGFEMMMSAARSRGIFFVPILQGTSQLERNYGKESAKIIMDNCKLTFFSGISAMSEDAEFFSKKMGNQTVEMNSVSNSSAYRGSSGSKSRSLSMTAQPLMTPDDIREMKKGDFIILRTADAGNTAHPIKCHFDIFMDWGITLGKGTGESENDYNIIPVQYSSREEIENSISAEKAANPVPASTVSQEEFDNSVSVDPSLPEWAPVDEYMLEQDEPEDDEDTAGL